MHNLQSRTAWKTSSRCGSGGCIEVGHGPAEVRIRDTTDPTGPQLRFAPEAFRDFLAAVKEAGFTVTAE